MHYLDYPEDFRRWFARQGYPPDIAQFAPAAVIERYYQAYLTLPESQRTPYYAQSAFIEAGGYAVEADPLTGQVVSYGVQPVLEELQQYLPDELRDAPFGADPLALFADDEDERDNPWRDGLFVFPAADVFEPRPLDLPQPVLIADAGGGAVILDVPASSSIERSGWQSMLLPAAAIAGLVWAVTRRRKRR